MAINIFKNVTGNLTTANTSFYTAPAGYTGIVLMAQVSNLTANTISSSMFVQAGGNVSSLATEFQIPGNDSATMLTGKLVLESGQQVLVSANANAVSQVVLSILETQN